MKTRAITSLRRTLTMNQMDRRIRVAQSKNKHQEVNRLTSIAVKICKRQFNAKHPENIKYKNIGYGSHQSKVIVGKERRKFRKEKRGKR